MATLSVGRAAVAQQASALERTAGIPWYIWCAALAATSLMIGGHWDISWHESIGRDAFWTPAHMAIYMCGVLSGIAFGYLILHTTFSRNSPLAAHSVHIWGFRAPLGAFIASWGAIAMLTSAPFDNWWHNAYGLDVKIVSPPHILLFIGGYAVKVGTMVLIAGHMNRALESAQAVYRRLFVYICGMTLVTAMIVLMEYTERSALHLALPYVLVTAIVPLILIVASRTTGVRFAATYVTGFYTLLLIGLILFLPLFPAQPKLGPVYQRVTHFIPPEFPLLLIVPAFVLDLFWQRTRSSKPWTVAFYSSLIFLGILLPLEWRFAEFLMSPASRNAFFGTTYLYYALPPTSYLARNEFFPGPGVLQFSIALLLAIALGTLTMRWGCSCAKWFRAIQR